MKLDSKYFDSIRISRRGSGAADKHAHQVKGGCQWKGCEKPATHKAPKGRGRDGEYINLCIEHVRQYNATYNYFDGMTDAEVGNFQKDALTGHRPTWKVGANAWASGSEENLAKAESRVRGTGSARAAGAFAKWRHKRAETEAEPTARRVLKPLEKKSLDVLHLGDKATREEIKTRFKELVKQHHPDANGGDTRSEEKLREIIQAYNYLKQAGLV
jgi:hypothetical protein